MSVDRTRQIIDRATWGWTKALDAEVRGQGWEPWLESQLDPESIDDGEVEALLADYTTLDAPVTELRDLVIDGQQVLVIGEVSHAAVLRMLHSKRQLYEVMVDFWTNHFNVMVLDEQVTIPLQTDHDRRVARPHALGSFEDLLLADAHSPAMLVYLDQWLSSSTSSQGVNVNFARETLELHTLGIVDGVQPYAETDVRGLANVLAGLSVDPATGAYLYRPTYHANIAVSLLGGAWSTPGVTGAAGEADATSVLTFLAHRPETARHLAWKLCRRFVADDPPDDLVDDLADVYVANDTAIVPVLRALFTSEAFFEAAPKYRRGLEAVVATLRAVEADVDPDPIGPASGILHTSVGALSRVGQPLFRYQDPDGYPETRADWLSSDGALKRWYWNGLTCGGVVPGVAVDVEALLGSPPATAGTLVDAAVRRLLGSLALFPDPGFGDVSSSHPFYAEISWMADAGISTGYVDGTYRPSDTVTRQAMSAFLYRAAGEPVFSPPAQPTFTDVSAGHPFYADIEWMAAEGISTGYLPGPTYRPNAAVTRAAMSAFLYRADGTPAFDPPGQPTFTDVSAGHPFYPEIEWMAAEGISTGYVDGTYRPSAAVTRAAMSAFLYRAADAPSTSLLPPEDRAALVTVFGTETTPITSTLLDQRLSDLFALVLSTTTFQHR